MKLTLESGRVIHDATEADILASIEGEHFAILGGDDTYIQYWVDETGKGPYTLEYQEGSLDKHYRAVGEPITRDRVLSALIKYLRGDESWRLDFRWETIELHGDAGTTLKDIADALGDIDSRLSDVNSKLSQIGNNTSNVATVLLTQLSKIGFLTLILLGLLVVLIVHVWHHW